MADFVEEILAAFRERGSRAYGESVTERQHGLQCATLAQREGCDDAMVAACLLHDFGHLLHDLGEDIADRGVDGRHEHLGANRLSAWFPPEVVEPIRLHAEAKRYLCWKEDGYYAGLSTASQKSLALQGGPMTEAEAKAFEVHAFFGRAVVLRRYDDRGKDPAMETEGVESFASLLRSVARGGRLPAQDSIQCAN
jgi:[1-hydroxy-2-(trimethylamino)ethyl]phosphonate dioxygenase